MHANDEAPPPRRVDARATHGHPRNLLELSKHLDLVSVDRVEYGPRWRRAAGAAVLFLALLLAVSVGGAISIVVFVDAPAAGGVVLAVLAALALVRAVVFSFAPPLRSAIRSAERLLRFIVRTAAIVATALGLAIVVLLVAVRYEFPDEWTTDEDDAVYAVIAVAVASVIIVFIARDRAPLLRAHTAFTDLVNRARPITAILLAVLTIAGAVVVPIVPRDGSQAAPVTAIIQTLAAVASIMLAGGFAWMTVAVTSTHHDERTARELAVDLLALANGARRMRAAVGRGRSPGDESAESDALLDALTRVSTATGGRLVRQTFVPITASQGIHLAFEGTLSGLYGIPLGPVAARFARSIDGAFDDAAIPDVGTRLTDLEMFARELAARARTGETSAPAAYARNLRAAASSAAQTTGRNRNAPR
ncbi:hypothetical protein GCM10011490_25450 [Pseudoclavibacter endophyticus]|uniref:Uncharacterized protein n=1 Tax=Pseudoclavibacter endophyticus TaxID=1778590 RepID=A0A6H9WKA7_9MICO|nr:hypothetical protein [Pseudoclavibacter endophyticus]KAB1647872.1 hypothetical protein F8O04_12705 [Pseudoclavibacter endophyticus]GGA73501.1 hypothetical protein GCM10011490_25450 [Pseudoclavibacter endophyticus]